MLQSVNNLARRAVKAIVPDTCRSQLMQAACEHNVIAAELLCLLRDNPHDVMKAVKEDRRSSNRETDSAA